MPGLVKAKLRKLGMLTRSKPEIITQTSLKRSKLSSKLSKGRSPSNQLKRKSLNNPFKKRPLKSQLTKMSQKTNSIFRMSQIPLTMKSQSNHKKLLSRKAKSLRPLKFKLRRKSLRRRYKKSNQKLRKRRCLRQSNQLTQSQKPPRPQMEELI